MKAKEPKIGEFKLHDNDKTVMVAHKPCDRVYNSLGDISFTLQGVRIELQPRGYMYSLDGDVTKCFIGIEKIPDSANQYRLGTIFLRNFYTGLDYDNNLILMGVNKVS